MPQPMLTNNISTENVFLGGQFFVDVTYTNSTGSEVTITAGRVLGRILATGLVLPQVAAATDGSEMPRGIAGDTYVVANGATAVLSMCTKGYVNQNKLLLNGAETINTIVRTVSTGGGTIGDLLIANTEIILVPSTELSGYDN